MGTPAPRFVWYAPYGTSSVAAQIYVLDTQPPDGEPGQVTKFGAFNDKAQAVMVTLALNGQQQ